MNKLLINTELLNAFGICRYARRRFTHRFPKGVFVYNDQVKNFETLCHPLTMGSISIAGIPYSSLDMEYYASLDVDWLCRKLSVRGVRVIYLRNYYVHANLFYICGVLADCVNNLVSREKTLNWGR